MDLLAYVRVLRRHWVLVLILVLVGGGLAAASTQIDNGSQQHRHSYYKASNTLVLDTSSSSGSYPAAYTNLDQISLLATTGSVQDDVAKKLGTGEVGRQLAKHITTLSNGSTKTLEITAVEPDPGEAVKLANAFAEALVAEITGREAQRYNQSRDQIIQTLDSLQSQIAQLDTQLKGSPPNSSVVTAQRNGLVNQYQVVYANFQQLAS